MNFRHILQSATSDKVCHVRGIPNLLKLATDPVTSLHQPTDRSVVLGEGNTCSVTSIAVGRACEVTDIWEEIGVLT